MSNSNGILSRKNSVEQLTHRNSNLFNSSSKSSIDSSGSKTSHYITESGNNRLSLHDSLDHELDDAIYESRSVLDHYCPVDRVDVDQVMHLLETRYGLKHDSIIGSCSLSGGIFSPLEGGSTSLASLFSSVLSRIALACKIILGTKVGIENVMDRMQFSVQEGRSEVGKKAHVMVLGAVDEDTDWRNAPLCILIHESWSLLHSHGTIYARNRFSNTKTREWVPVIFISPESDNVRVQIGIYTRSGLFKTESLDFLSAMPPKSYDWKAEYIPMITKEQAFRKFVRGILGLYNAEYTKAGMDITRHPTSPHILLPFPLGLGVIKEVYCERQCVCGRATRVYLVQQEDTNNHAAVLETFEKCPPNDETSVSVDNSPSPGVTLDFGLSRPWSIIVKDCWPCASENNELSIFQSLNGQFGLPVLLHGYSVRHSTCYSPLRSVVPCDSRFWEPEHRNRIEALKPAERIHKRLVFKTLGRSVVTAQTPKELLQAIMHAMLGHYNMFKNGWLHCDVSIGNVLIMDPTELRSPLTDFEFTKCISKCEGFLTDGDQAIRRDTEGIYEWTASGRPKGTPMFMSQHLITAWNSGRRVNHTVIDDLESFVWVFIWAVFEILQSKRIALHPAEESFTTFMTSKNLSSILCRMDIADYVQRPDAANDASDGFKSFVPLLRDWFENMASSNRMRELLVSSQSSDEKEDICKSIYGAYLTTALNWSKELPDVWGPHG